MALTTILGAGGTISHELVKILSPKGTPMRLVGRNPKPVAGAEVLTADISDANQAIKAISGSSTVHLLLGLKYDVKVWQQLWPRIMANTIEACKRAGLRCVAVTWGYNSGTVLAAQGPLAMIDQPGELLGLVADRESRG